MVNATASAKPRDGIDFLPLSVDFEEKLYAVGKIPGSFLKREGRPSDKAVLSSRVVDRPIRPLFPKDMRNDVSVVMTVLSVDPDCVPEIAGMIGASMALSISDIPWNGPIAGINVGLVDGEIILTPNAEQRQKSDLQLTVAGTAEKVCMIEAGANEVDDDTMLEAIMKGFAEVQKMVAFIKEVQAEIGKPKVTFESQEIDHDLFEAIKDEFIEDVRAAMDTDDKNIRDERMRPIYDRLHAEYDEKYPEQGAMLDECIYKLQKFVVRRWLLDDGKRVDGRGMDEIRPLDAEVGIIPRVHGSGMFTRGQTQVLTIATLGTIREAQILDGIDEQTTKRYIHQYNMPSYSVGETRPSRGPGRRAEALLQTRPGLAAGMILFLVLLKFLGGFVWCVDFGAMDADLQPMMRQLLADCAIHEGTRLTKPLLQAAQAKALRRSETFGWISLNFIGGCLSIESTPAQTRTVREPPPTAGLYARADGVILAVEIESGFAAVEPGQTVTAGQPLAAAEKPDRKGNAVIQGAQGRIVARVQRQYTAGRPLTVRTCAYTGRSTERTTLYLPGYTRTEETGTPLRSAETQTEWQPLRLGRLACLLYTSPSPRD